MRHVFISYSSGDFCFAEILKEKVEEAGFEVWTFESKLLAGENWREDIDKAIREAFAVIVVLTPASKVSEYVVYEWAFACGYGVKVIPIILTATDLHPRLGILQYLNFTNGDAQPWTKLIERIKDLSGNRLSNTVEAQDNRKESKDFYITLKGVDILKTEIKVRISIKSDHSDRRRLIVYGYQYENGSTLVDSTGRLYRAKTVSASGGENRDSRQIVFDDQSSADVELVFPKRETVSDWQTLVIKFRVVHKGKDSDFEVRFDNTKHK